MSAFKLDSSPRYVRVTYRDGAKRRQWTGNVRRDGDVLRGERRDDTPGGQPGDITLHLLFAFVTDVVRIDRLDPVYEEWVKLEGWQ
jgi:hypothetical protein